MKAINSRTARAGNRDGSAKYREVSDALRKEILAGKYAPGERFPSLKMLCRRFDMSYLTAVKVQESLKELGLVKSRNGAGTFVTRRLTSVGLIVPMLKQSEIYPPICQEFSRQGLLHAGGVIAQGIAVGCPFCAGAEVENRLVTA